MLRVLLLSFLVFQLLSQTIPSIKLSLDFDQINNFKNGVIKPLVEKNLDNLKIAGPFEFDTKILLADVKMIIWNLEVLSHSIDWNNTQLSANKDNTINLVLQNLIIKISTDYNIIYLGSDHKGTDNLTLNQLSASLTLKFINSTSESGFQASIVSATIDYKSVDLDIQDKKFLSWIIDKVFNIGKCLIVKQLQNFIMTDVNSQIIDLTSKKINFTLNSSIIPETLSNLNISLPLNLPSEYQVYTVNITLNGAPYIRYVEPNFEYFTIAINLGIYNEKTKDSPNNGEKDILPYRKYMDQDIQGFFCNSFLSHSIWMLLNSGLINITANNDMLPKESPIHLNTSQLLMLLPGMTVKYGKDKGVYVVLTSGSEYSKIVFRSGRLVTQISLVFDFYVDKNSMNYPKEGLNNCKECEKALSFNTTIILALHADNDDEKTILARVIDLDFPLLSILSTTIDIDGDSFHDLFKNIAGSFIPIINAGIAQGFPNPLIGLLDIEHMLFKFGVDNLWFMLKFAQKNRIIN